MDHNEQASQIAQELTLAGFTVCYTRGERRIRAVSKDGQGLGYAYCLNGYVYVTSSVTGRETGQAWAQDTSAKVAKRFGRIADQRAKEVKARKTTQAKWEAANKAVQDAAGPEIEEVRRALTAASEALKAAGIDWGVALIIDRALWSI